MFRIKPAHAGLVFALSLTAAGAAEHNDANVLGTMIVTATRYPVPLDEVLPASIVIERDELERSLSPDITDILRFRTGFEIGRYGGPGQTSPVFLRGTDSNHALVLVDGVRINPGTVGGAALQNLSPQLVERIEIVKGPRSTLYGTDAIGGVIQVFTQANHAQDFSASASYGSNATMNGSATAGWRGERARVGFGVNYTETDGIPPRISDPRGGAYDELSFNVAGSIDVGTGSLGASFWRAEGSVDYIGFSARDFGNAHITQDFLNEAGVVHYEWRLGSWQSRFEVGRMVDDIDQRLVRDSLGSFESGDYSTTHRTTFGWQNDFDLSDWQRLSAGISVADETARNETFGEIDTDVTNLYVQDRLSLGRHDIALALGYVDHETAGGHTTWNAEYGLEIAPAWRLVASAGTAFRAPDATDRFGFGGNIDLEPEQSRHYEIAIRHALARDQRLSLSAFQNDIDELITFVITDPTTFDGQLQNLDRARIRGVELSYEIVRNSWRLTAEAIYQDPQDLVLREQLLRRAKENFTLNYWRRFGRFELGVHLLAAGDRKD
ncbi:MAG TPA: TonB-dependent receptor, partial [Steroidobacteraceae bacterium]